MTNRFLFTIQPQSGIPLYRQIVDQVRGQVAGGRLAAGELLPSVRQLASDLQINMMTVSKAYSLLEAEGLIERIRGTGMRVKPGAALSSVAERQQELRPLVEDLVARAEQLNLTDPQLLALLKSVQKEHKSLPKAPSHD
ncbi:MAG: GntR family transcriptional regulator [Planctomycetales bacterium]